MLKGGENPSHTKLRELIKFVTRSFLSQRYIVCSFVPYEWRAFSFFFLHAILCLLYMRIRLLGCECSMCVSTATEVNASRDSVCSESIQKMQLYTGKRFHIEIFTVLHACGVVQFLIAYPIRSEWVSRCVAFVERVQSENPFNKFDE